MIAALLGALLVGLSLGLLGSGGSILTVPVLVYLVGQPERIAIVGSLLIVGGIAAVGAIPFGLRRAIDWRSVVLFGIPGMLGAWAAGRFLAPHLSGVAQLVLFAGVMLLAAWMMARPKVEAKEPGVARAPWKIMLDVAESAPKGSTSR